MRTQKTTADIIRAYLTKNPTANVAKVAEKFNTSKPVIYKLRKEVLQKAVTQEVLPAPESNTPPAPQSSPVETDVRGTLDARGTRYGTFKGLARVTQEIKRAMSEHARAHDKGFTDSQWEALEMIALKLGRIVNGDPDYADSWLDIAGYAMLVADELAGVSR
jgi:hypothetical protein